MGKITETDLPITAIKEMVNNKIVFVIFVSKKGKKAVDNFSLEEMETPSPYLWLLGRCHVVCLVLWST